jgi:flagellar motor protein MotB
MRMSKLGLVKVLVVLAVVCVALPQTGCASSKEKNRLKVLKAENADLVQRTGMLQGQVADAQSQSDMRSAELQQAQFELAEKDRRAQEAEANKAAAMARANALASQQNEALVVLEEHQRQQAALVARLERENEEKRQLELALLAERNRARPVAAPQGRPETIYGGDSKELVAFQRDLQRRLSSQGVDAPVEIRTASDGQRRVAVVLPDAFKAGKATLAYNADAVTTVVRLGQLVQADYPNSTISIEGHTDSDPIRRSNWQSNEHLSRARAEHVAKLLTDTGIQGARVEAIGRGARQPIERGATPRAKSANRRVELFIDPRAR